MWSPLTSQREHKGRHVDRGAVAVEMALVSPILIAMIVGIIDFSRVFNAEIQLSQAAREGVRLASLQLGTLNTPVVQERARLAAPNPAFGAALLAENVTVTGCAASPAATAVATVTVTYQFHGFLFMKNPLNDKPLTQTAVMRCGG